MTLAPKRPSNATVVTVLLLLVAALAISMPGYDRTGPLWPDSPRYLGAATMIHDWLGSGEYGDPVGYAARHYIQYPGFSLPYHPPVFPALVALFFKLFGMSYFTARLFVALCLWGMGWAFLFTLRELDVGPRVALACTAVLMTLPETTLWARDLMSEVPALCLMLIGSYLFVRWLKTDRWPWIWAAFLFAEMAFLSRVSTSAIIPAWFVAVVAFRGWKALRSPQLILAGVLYLVVNGAWVQFVKNYNTFEVQPMTTVERLDKFSWESLTYYLVHLPDMTGWVVLLLAIVGTGVGLWIASSQREARGALILWLAWFGSNWAFWAAFSAFEQRYFYFALPSVAAVIAYLFHRQMPNLALQRAAAGALGLGLALNVWHVTKIPDGVVGYEAVAERLAAETRPGNVLMASPFFQEFIFRFEAEQPEARRILHRADRTLAVRLPVYTHVEAQMLADDPQDAIDVLQKGRIRYLLTAGENERGWKKRYPEEVMTHDLATGNPDRFALVEKFPLRLDYGIQNRVTSVYLWEYLDDLPPGESELAVVIPTARMTLAPDGDSASEP